MTTISYPAAGKNGFPVDKWDNIFGAADGIIEDYATTPATSAFALTRIDAGNICRIGLGVGRVNGYELEVTAAHDLVCPTAAGTYWIAICYDPALNVPDGVTGNAPVPGGACSLVISATLDTAGGKQYLALYKIVRGASQSLPAAALSDYRTWVGPVFVMPSYQTPATGFGPWPRGSHLFQTGVRDVHCVRDLNDAGTALIWRHLDFEASIALPLVDGFAANDAAPATPSYYRFARCMVKARGKVKKTAGSFTAGAAITVAQMPNPGWLPLFQERFMGDSSSGPAEVYINPGGAVVVKPVATATWVDLSCLIYRAEA